MKPLVIVDLVALVMEDFGQFAASSLHRDIAPDRPLSVIGPQDPIPDAAGVVVTGSPVMLRDAKWAKPLANRLVKAAEGGTPILGICFGHQLLARHFGAKIGSWDQEMNGLATVRFNEHGPFVEGDHELLHTHKDFVATPGRMIPVATGGLGGIQALAHGRLPIWTLQAHPEARTSFLEYLPPHALDVMSKLSPGAMDTPDGKSILARFGNLLTRFESRAIVN